MTRALVEYEGGKFEIMQRAARAMVESGYFKDARDVAQAVVKVMAGAEIGIPPFAAMTGIHVVNGKPVLSSNLIATLVKNDPRYDYRVESADDKGCAICWYENGEARGYSTFTLDEATNAGLAGKAVWKQYPSDMLFARALTRGARRFAPGIFAGAPVYTAEEIGADIDEEGNVIDVTPQKVEYTEEPPVEDSPQPQADHKRQMSIADARAKLEENGNVTWGTLASLVVAVSDHYADEQHVLNALNAEDGYTWPEGHEDYQAETKSRVKKDTALRAYDWLLERTEATA